jgi:agmatine deiminase
MLDLDHPTPVDLGYRLPAEWTPHAATWTSWPSDDALWEGELDAVRSRVRGHGRAAHALRDVVVNVADDEAERDAARACARSRRRRGRVRYHRVPLDDAWFRDNGPIFLVNGAGQVALTDWCSTPGAGSTRHGRDTLVPDGRRARAGHAALRLPVRDGGRRRRGQRRGRADHHALVPALPDAQPAGLGEEETEALLRAGLGVRHVVWLERGLEGDHTDGHVDTIVRFCDDTHAGLRRRARTPTTRTTPPLQANLEALQDLRTPDGEPFTVVPLPLPEQRRLPTAGRWPRRTPTSTSPTAWCWCRRTTIRTTSARSSCCARSSRTARWWACRRRT